MYHMLLFVYILLVLKVAVLLDDLKAEYFFCFKAFKRAEYFIICLNKIISVRHLLRPFSRLMASTKVCSVIVMS